jgi:hypothetical protein
MSDTTEPEATPSGHHRALGIEKSSPGRTAVPRGLARIVRRDPENFAERLTLYAVRALAGESWDWAERWRRENPSGSPVRLEDETRKHSARVARLDGAVSGCPLYVALVPAYTAVLFQQVRMVQRIAALNGRDPRAPRMAAESLALRDIYPTVDAAEEALEKLPEDLPERAGEFRGVRTWVELVRKILVLIGLLAPPEEGRAKPSFLRKVGNLALGGGVWIMTWVIPGLFMVLMSWTCESSTRKLGARAVEFYSDLTPAEREAAKPGELEVEHDRGHHLRAAVRWVLAALAVAIPMGLLLLAAIEQKAGHRVIWLSVVGSLTALALVAGLASMSRR